MKRHLQLFEQFLNEAKDPSYYQETFYFTALISMSKDVGGSRDETKNDIRALSEILTVTLVEPEKGGIQRDIGNKYISTLKIHVRKPRDTDKVELMKSVVAAVNALTGVAVLRYKEKKIKPRRKPFRGKYELNERDWQSASHRREVQKDSAKLTGGGPQTTGGAPYATVHNVKPSYSSSPPGAEGGGWGASLEEGSLDEAMVGPEGLPEDIVIAVDKSQAPRSFRAYYALKEDPSTPLKAGDLDRMEAGIDVYGNIYAALGQDFPYEGHYVITSVKAADKYGPLLYDVMMELAGKAGLKPDTESLSDDASAVWRYYDTSRDDVDGVELGPAGEPLPPDAYRSVMPEEQAAKPQDNAHLAKYYVKKGRAVLEALRAAGQLADASDAPEPSAGEELSDLAGELDIPIVKNTDLSRFDRLREDIILQVGALSDDLLAFDVQEDLNQKIWDGDSRLHPGVAAALMDIVEEFLEGIDLGLEVKDVVLTGSLANYNWSKFSDIDLHILLEFGHINEDQKLVKKFFDAVRSRWNKLHDIRVKGHEVEIYVQDQHEPHTSTGVYSLMEDNWLVKPTKIKPQLDKASAEKKMRFLAKEIDKLAALYHNKQYESALEMGNWIKDKIKRMRQAGLERAGIYAPENLAFKMLRRSGDIERLFDMYTRAYDQVYSLDQ
jgi:predicted nucleotidyltransferase